MFNNKIVLITGGTGSFGQAVLNRLLKYDIKEIRIFSRDEKKQDDMRKSIKNSKVKFYIGDVRDFDSVDYAMKNVDFVFHAAALKQVPSCEFYPMEAVKTNVEGSDNVFKSAIKNKVKKVVLLSTDKAVYPVNAMGISKAMAEKCMIARARNIGDDETIFCATRYGNVMASRGSVIPLFIDQIKRNEALTVTNTNMTRFLMSLSESVELVIYALLHGKQGDIFVQKSPACTMGDLAVAIQKLLSINSGIKIIGTRHGEKLYETLLSEEEIARAEDLGRYYRIPCDTRDLNYDKYFIEGNDEMENISEYNSNNTYRLTVSEIVNLLKKLDFINKESM